MNKTSIWSIRFSSIRFHHFSGQANAMSLQYSHVICTKKIIDKGCGLFEKCPSRAAGRPFCVPRKRRMWEGIIQAYIKLKHRLILRSAGMIFRTPLLYTLYTRFLLSAFAIVHCTRSEKKRPPSLSLSRSCICWSMRMFDFPPSNFKHCGIRDILPIFQGLTEMPCQVSRAGTTFESKLHHVVRHTTLHAIP